MSMFAILLQQKNCTVAVVDDLDFEPDEEFHLRLADPVTEGGLPARLGDIEVVTVTITNHDDGQSLTYCISCVFSPIETNAVYGYCYVRVIKSCYSKCDQFIKKTIVISLHLKKQLNFITILFHTQAADERVIFTLLYLLQSPRCNWKSLPTACMSLVSKSR